MEGGLERGWQGTGVTGEVRWTYKQRMRRRSGPGPRCTGWAEGMGVVAETSGDRGEERAVRGQGSQKKLEAD